jgi:uncharacterized protein YkwD
MRSIRATVLAAALAAALVLVPTAGASAAEGISDPTPSFDASAAPSQSTVVKKILKDTNAARRNVGLPALKLDTAVSKVAAAWSKKQHTNRKMSHNPNYAKQIPAGWRSAGENVAYGYDYRTVTRAWLDSPGHRANILNRSFTHIGIGFYEKGGQRYYTQVFAQYPATAKSTAKAPGAPGTPRAAAPLRTGATVSWAAPRSSNGSKVTGYRLTIAGGGKATRTIAVTSTAHKLTGLKPGTRYAVSVRAVNAEGVGATTPTVRFTTRS